MASGYHLWIEPETVRGVIEGDPAAQEAFYAGVMCVCDMALRKRRVAPHAIDFDDFRQEVAILCFANAPKFDFDRGTRPVTYFFKIAVNKLRDSLRNTTRRLTRERTVTGCDLGDSAFDCEVDLRVSLRGMAKSRNARVLSERQVRRVREMRAEGHSINDIAKVIGIGYWSVRDICRGRRYAGVGTCD